MKKLFLVAAAMTALTFGSCKHEGCSCATPPQHGPKKECCEKGKHHKGEPKGECRGEQFKGGCPEREGEMRQHHCNLPDSIKEKIKAEREQWKNFDNLSEAEQKALIQARKARIDERDARIEAARREFEAKWENFDNLSIQEQKELLDAKVGFAKFGPQGPGCPRPDGHSGPTPQGDKGGRPHDGGQGGQHHGNHDGGKPAPRR